MTTDTSQFVAFSVHEHAYTPYVSIVMKVKACQYMVPAIPMAFHDDEGLPLTTMTTKTVEGATYKFTIKEFEWKEWEHHFRYWIRDHQHPFLSIDEVVLQMETDVIKWCYNNPGHWLSNTILKNPVASAEAIVMETFPALKQLVKNPETGKQATLKATIIKLNDTHKWSREKIADWLETLDLDINAKDPEHA